MTHKRIGVVLAGCGHLDGAEIQEAVLTLLAIDRAGADAVCMAPDKEQVDVVNHRTGKPSSEKRNVLLEAARIARGKIRPVHDVNPEELDAVILPGGYGAAKNLVDFATAGAQCKVDPAVAALLRAVHTAGKPIAALCIAPAVLASLFGKALHPDLTIGDDAGTAAALEEMGAHHVRAGRTDVVVDRKNRFVTSPCYMYEARIGEVALGAERAVHELLLLAGAKPAPHA